MIDIFEQLKEFGTAYIAAMVMVAVIAVVDVFCIIRVLTKRREDLHEYAEFMIKNMKIAVLALLGAYFILQTLDERIITSVRILHIAIGCTALADAAANLIIKLKFSRK